MKITFNKNDKFENENSSIRIFVKDLVDNAIQIDLKPGEFVYSETDYITNSVRIYLKRGIISVTDEQKAKGLEYYIGYRSGEIERLAKETAEKEEIERLAKETAEKEEAERLAKETAEKEEAERLAKETAEKEETERLAKETAEKEEVEPVLKKPASVKKKSKIGRPKKKKPIGRPKKVKLGRPKAKKAPGRPKKKKK